MALVISTIACISYKIRNRVNLVANLGSAGSSPPPRPPPPSRSPQVLNRECVPSLSASINVEHPPSYSQAIGETWPAMEQPTSPYPQPTNDQLPPPFNPHMAHGYFPETVQPHPYGYNGSPAQVSGHHQSQQAYQNPAFQYN